MENAGFLKKNFLAIFAAFMYLGAAITPLGGAEWGSVNLIVYFTLLTALAAASLWRLARPARSYPLTDIVFVASLVITVNVFSVLLGPEKDWLQPMNYLIVALCALYYSLLFNFAVAGLILALEVADAALMPGKVGGGQVAGLAVFAAYLAGTALVLGRLFQSEHRKKERAMQTVRRLQEGAESLGRGQQDDSVASISPEGRISSLVESAAELDTILRDLLDAVRAAIPSENALLFMADSGGESLYLRVRSGGPDVQEECAVQFGQGLVGWVAKERRPLVVAENPRGLSYLRDDSGAGSFVAAPILNGSFLEGVIALDSKVEGMFGEPEKEALVRFAEVALYLLRNARAYQQVDLSAKNFAALHRISAEVSSTLDVKTIIEKLAELAREVVPYDYLTISFTEGEDAVVFKTLRGYEGVETPLGPVPLAGSLMGWIVENRSTLCFTELDQRADRLPIFPAKELRGECRSFLGIPFMSQDKVLGVFTVAMRTSGSISAYQQHTLSIIANQVAVNIANARLHQMMRQMATTDGLTGLINHRHFQEKADEEFARASRYPQPLSLLLFDIDHFKRINDTYGHPVGDAVLKKVGRILREAVRSVDIAARYGGEEFVSLLVNTDAKGAQQMAERIRGTIEKNRFLWNGENIPVTMSVGFATYPDDAADKKDLIEKADQALYWAKGNGRNRAAAYRAIAGAAPKNS